jgi:hypothetical protein
MNRNGNAYAEECWSALPAGYDQHHCCVLLSNNVVNMRTAASTCPDTMNSGLALQGLASNSSKQSCTMVLCVHSTLFCNTVDSATTKKPRYKWCCTNARGMYNHALSTSGHYISARYCMQTDNTALPRRM